MNSNDPPSNPQPWSDVADEREQEQAIESAWLEWRERLRGAVFEGAGVLKVDATALRRNRGGRPRSASKWGDETTIAEAQADLRERGLLPPGRGDLPMAVHRVAEFLKSKNIVVDEEFEFKTIVRRIIKGEEYKS